MTTIRQVRRAIPVVLLVTWLGIGVVLGPYTGKLGEVATNDQAAFLPRSAESTRVIEAQRAFSRDETLPLIIVWTAESTGGSVGPRQRDAAARVLASLKGVRGIAGQPSPVITSRDGRALQGVVQLRPDLGDALPGTLGEVRRAADRVPGTAAGLAGPAASQADLSAAFSGIDGVLLIVAVVAVLVILLLVYRCLLLPLVIILGAVLALGLAAGIVHPLADRGILRVDGQVQGILSILVIGAATDYALLVSARYREELARGTDRRQAMWTAWRRSLGAICASAATVALGLLALLLSDLTNNRALGPVGAIGILCALVSALTFLPAALVLLGRAAYWPTGPRPGGAATAGLGLWDRIAGLVDRRPRRVWSLTLLGLLACAAFAPTLDAKGVPLDEVFITDAPSVAAQETLGTHFPGGSGNPAIIIADAGRAAQVVAAARTTDGVAAAAPVSESGRPGGRPHIVGGRVRIEATLRAAADSDEATATVRRLRDRVHAVPDANALVGGYTAQRYDTQRTAEQDRTTIVPVVLGVILIILIGLLRSLLLPVALVITVALNFAATLGVAALVFEHLLGFTGTDASVPLYGFVFLVALGVDYNIFLMSRVREESRRHGIRQGVLVGVTSTGGVITSAGVVLAATFAALVVVPLAFLLQIAFIVSFGVLLDTLIVRSLLVPALVRDAGRNIWWPGRLSRRPTSTGGAASTESDDRYRPAPR